MVKKSFIIIGAGRFGCSLAKTLHNLNHEVLLVDRDEDIIQQMSEEVTHAIIGSGSDEGVLRALGVRNFDVAVVTIGENIQESILVTVLLKELGVKYVVAKAKNELHAKILGKIGADKVIFPERDMGVRVAYNLSQGNFVDFIELSPNFSIVEIVCPEKWVGKSLLELELRKHFGINVMAIKNNDKINAAPKAEDKLKADDFLVVIASNEDLQKVT